jgi:hypothetical protein
MEEVRDQGGGRHETIGTGTSSKWGWWEWESYPPSPPPPPPRPPDLLPICSLKVPKCEIFISSI